MGIWSIAGGVGGAVLVPILAMSIVRFGWRNTAILTGFVILVTVLPLTLFVRNKPEDMGLLPDNRDPKLLEKTAEEDTEVDFTTWEALKTKTFKYLIIAESLRSVLLSSLVVHQIPYLISIGVPQEAAAGILGLMITLSIPGRFVFGYLGDFFDMRKLIFLASVMQAVGVFIFAWMPGLMGAYTFVVIYGFAYGGIITVTVSLRGKLFGRKRYATVTGILSPFQMIGSVIGPIFAGYIFDVYKDYRLAFYTFSVLALISAITYMLVKPEQPYMKLEKIQCA
jgi:sugar phosphate permease